MSQVTTDATSSGRASKITMPRSPSPAKSPTKLREGGSGTGHMPAEHTCNDIGSWAVNALKETTHDETKRFVLSTLEEYHTARCVLKEQTLTLAQSIISTNLVAATEECQLAYQNFAGARTCRRETEEHRGNREQKLGAEFEQQLQQLYDAFQHCCTDRCVPGVAPSVWTAVKTVNRLLMVGKQLVRTHVEKRERSSAPSLADIIHDASEKGQLMAQSSPNSSPRPTEEVASAITDWDQRLEEHFTGPIRTQ